MTAAGSREEAADPVRLAFAIAVPIVLVAAASGLSWFSDQTLTIGPLDRTAFGWVIVVPLWLSAPVAAGFVWRSLDGRQTKLAGLAVASIVSGRRRPRLLAVDRDALRLWFRNGDRANQLRPSDPRRGHRDRRGTGARRAAGPRARPGRRLLVGRRDRTGRRAHPPGAHGRALRRHLLRAHLLHPATTSPASVTGDRAGARTRGTASLAFGRSVRTERQTVPSRADSKIEARPGAFARPARPDFIPGRAWFGMNSAGAAWELSGPAPRRHDLSFCAHHWPRRDPHASPRGRRPRTARFANSGFCGTGYTLRRAAWAESSGMGRARPRRGPKHPVLDSGAAQIATIRPPTRVELTRATVPVGVVPG
jgi:hypothetical protein